MVSLFQFLNHQITGGGLKVPDLTVPLLTRPVAARDHFRFRPLVVIETRDRGFDVEFRHGQRFISHPAGWKDFCRAQSRSSKDSFRFELIGMRNPGMQEKSRFMVSWVPYRNRVAGVWFRHEKPLRFRAGPAGGAAPSAPSGATSL